MNLKKIFITICVLVLATLPVFADEATTSAQQASLYNELAVTAALGTLWVAPELFEDDIVREHRCPCESSSVNGFDRPYAGRQIKHIAKTSDALLMASLIAAPATYALAVPHAGVGGALLRDGLTLAQVLAANGVVNQMFKYSMQRPRPYTYGLEADDKQLEEPDAFLSFYSGHTSTMFATTFGVSEILRRRLPESRVSTYVLATGVALSTAVGVMRVSSGKHFPTDVLTGAVAGIAFGYGVPAYKNAATGVELMFMPTVRGPALSSNYRW